MTKTSCGCTDTDRPHMVFITAPPGYGSVMPCTPETERYGVRVTHGPDGKLVRLDGRPLPPPDA